MQPNTPPARLQTGAFISLIAAAALIARLLPGARTIDDAFITFRYSRNIVEGLGFVYNPGVQTLGTTTPLFTLLMAAISALTGGQDFPQYALVVSALADAATAVLLFLLARRFTGSALVGLTLGLLWAVAPRSVTFAVGGMETSVNTLWLVGAVWWYVSGRDLLLGLFAALGFLTRVDAALWIAPLLLHQWWMRARTVNLPGEWVGSIPVRTWLAALLPLLPWFAFSLWYFGSPLPNSVSAKTVAYVIPPGATLVTFVQNYATPFFEFDTFGSVGAMLGAVIYLTLSLFGLLYARRDEPRLLPFLVYPWLYLAVFALANPLTFRWYIAPPMPALMFGIVVGLWSVLRRLNRGRAGRVSVGHALMGAAGALWLFMSVNAWTLTPDHGPNRPAPKMAWHQIELLYEQMGTALREDYGVTAGTRVGSADIGAVGYFSRATIVDTVGLVTPELVRYYPVDPALIPEGQNYAIPPALILDAQPEYLVTMEAFVRLGLEQLPEFQRGYALAQEIPTDFYGTGMRLYVRTDVVSLVSQPSSTFP
jgi:hypothetical protein